MPRHPATRVTDSPAPSPPPMDTPTNDVRLVGHVPAPPTLRELPSGDEVVSLRLVVPRERRRTPTGPTVDVIDVSCWSAATRRAALRLAEGDVIEVSGALRRRFFRVGAAVQSRYDVEARVVRRMTPGQRT
ncbi:MAG: single-stranded DNA-binding protein [Dermatophilaceae bacterium]